MKSTFTIIVLLGLLSFACSTSKQLPTDNGTDINISGTWNGTDASIVSSSLSQKFKESVYYANELVNKQSSKTLDLVIINYEGLTEPVDKTLEEQVKKAFSVLAYMDKNSEEVTKDDLLKMAIDIQEKLIQSYGEDAIQYNLFVKLYDLENTLVWESTESIKKYLAD